MAGYPFRKASCKNLPDKVPPLSDNPDMFSAPLRRYLIVRSAWRHGIACAFLAAAVSLAYARNDALVDYQYDSSQEVELPFEMKIPEPPRFPDRAFNLLDYGGVADAHTSNTQAFSKAIAACHKAGGGRVIVPPGRWFTGAIHLQSNVNLHLEDGATLLFSTNPRDYLPAVWLRWTGFECMNYSPLIYARDCKNIAITGQGTIDGQGSAWWHWIKREPEPSQRLYKMTIDNAPMAERDFAKGEGCFRPQLFVPINCENVLVEGVKVLSGPFWTLQFTYCSKVIVRHVTIHTTGPNTDGIDIDSSSDVLIEGCDVSTGDDCIALKAGLNEEGRRIGRPTERVIVRHCVTRSGNGGFVVGSDTSGSIRNAIAYDCDFIGTQRGIRLKSTRGRGGVVENIWCRDIRMYDIAGEAIQISTFYKGWFGSDTGEAPTFRNIDIENIKVEGAINGVAIDGLPEQPIENVTLKNLQIVALKGVACSEAQKITFDNVSIDPLKFNQVMTFTNCRDITVKNSRAPEGCDTFVEILEGEAESVRLIDNDLKRIKTPLKVHEKTDAEKVTPDAATKQAPAKAKPEAPK